METSPTVKELQAALCDFQKEAITVHKNAENPGFRRGNKAMKYADLNSILAVVLPALTSHGLALTQMPDAGGLTTRLMHVSGEWMQATSQMQPVANTPQALGSAITYARRYALGAMLGIVTEDDDDGNAASAPAPPRDYSADIALARQQIAAATSSIELRKLYDGWEKPVADAVKKEAKQAGERIKAQVAADAAGMTVEEYLSQPAPIQPHIPTHGDVYNDERGG